MTESTKADKTSWGIMILLTIIWGFSFILIKKSLVAFSPTQLASLRLAISSLTFSPVVYVYRKEIKWSDWKKFLAVGLTGSGIPAFLFFFAQTRISSSMAGLLNSLTPIWTLIISILLFGQPFHSKKMFGVLVGFAGASYLIFMGEHGIQGGAPLFASLVVFATLCYAMSVNMVQGFFGEVKPVIISSVSFFLLGPPAIIYLAFSDFPHVLVTHEAAPGALMTVAMLSLFGTVLASILFYHLVQRTSAVFGSTVTYLMPFSALLLGFLDGESVGFVHIAGMTTILLGVYITKSS
jgi:drug/metabolite transporter (DMT)-like permease